ncbi:MAG: p-hydroxycinnamoyl CoA hydratase/lyase [Immundisolibacteraceae bacterium]|nr:p-hydroxycinnamoyl CoA hydratase/lyase [Immundisolibacteraceae bacterium]
MSQYECVDLAVEGDVATVILNRPEKRNCLSPTLHRNMVDVLNVVAAEKCKVLVITGAGDSFSAGMDLEQCFLEPFDDPEKFNEINQPCFEWFSHLRNFPGVTVAKVNGWAFGGGFEIASICDIVIAAEESVWGLSEINFGIFPGGGATWSYAHNMTRKQALFYALTGATLTGTEALALGLATKVVPLADLDGEVDKWVTNLAQKGRAVLRKTKEVYEKSLKMTFEESVDWEMAKMWELSRETNDDWVRTALKSFSKREFKPGLQSYKLTNDV